MRKGAGLELVKDERMKTDKSTCGTTVSRQRENTRPGGDMERSVGEHAAESSQPCRKGWNCDRMSALEKAYGEYRIKERYGAQDRDNTKEKKADRKDHGGPYRPRCQES